MFKPELIRRYRTQPQVQTSEDKIEWSVLLKVIKRVTFNQTFVGVGLGLFLYPFQLYRGVNVTPESLPSWGTVIQHLCAYLMVEEIGFYYSHRLFHEKPSLYKKYHKVSFMINSLINTYMYQMFTEDYEFGA